MPLNIQILEFYSSNSRPGTECEAGTFEIRTQHHPRVLATFNYGTFGNLFVGRISALHAAKEFVLKIENL